MHHVDLLIVAAVQNELKSILKKWTGKYVPVEGLARTWLVQDYNLDIAVLITGVGKNKARKSLRKALKQIVPKHFLIAGWAGSLTENLKTGDLVVVRDQYQWRSAHSTVISCQHSFSDRIFSHLNEIGYKSVRCNGVTVDVMVDKKHTKDELSRSFPVKIVEMETFYLLEIFGEKGIAGAVLRIISDSADESIGLDFEKIPRTRKKRILYLMMRPKALLCYFKLLRSLNQTSDKLGRSLGSIVKYAGSNYEALR